MATTLLTSSLSSLRRVAIARATAQTCLPVQSATLLANSPSFCSFSTTTTTPLSKEGEVTKHTLISELVETHDLTKSQAGKILTTVFDSIIEAVGDGKTVKISSFGTFAQFVSKPTIRTNPNTQERIHVPSKNRIRFKPFKSFKNIVQPTSQTP